MDTQDKAFYAAAIAAGVLNPLGPLGVPIVAFVCKQYKELQEEEEEFKNRNPVADFYSRWISECQKAKEEHTDMPYFSSMFW